MPAMPVASATFQEVVASGTILTIDGNKSRVSLSGPSVSDASDAQIVAAMNAIGNLSNGRMVTLNVTSVRGINEATAEVYDEAHAAASTKAQLIFQNGARDIIRVEIPAPDASIFDNDGVTVNTGNALVVAANAAILAVINAGDPAGDYAYVRGFLTSRTRKTRRSQTAPASAEPGAGEFPGATPGT